MSSNSVDAASGSQGRGRGLFGSAGHIETPMKGSPKCRRANCTHATLCSGRQEGLGPCFVVELSFHSRCSLGLLVVDELEASDRR